MKVGFIGAGNMGGALAEAAKKAVGKDDVFVSASSIESAKRHAEKLGVKAALNNEIYKTCDFIFLGVKPYLIKKVVADAADILKNRSDFTLVTMAAGVEIVDVLSALDFSAPVIRIMPNTPVKIGKGTVPFTCSRQVTEKVKTEFKKVLGYAGVLAEVEENKIDAIGALAGSGPAFVYEFIDALATAGVECGLKKADALEFAEQTVAGAAELALYSGVHPQILKDEVMSPGGTTVEGVHALEKGGFKNAVMNAVVAAYNKTLAMKSKK